MYKLAVLALIAAIVPQAADARVKVVGEIPEDYWGEWTRILGRAPHCPTV
jgi:hypothetical protein